MQMAVEIRGRSAPTPPPPFAKGTGKEFAGVYSWNAPREAIGRERPLTRDELRQVQGVLSKIDRLPYFLSSLFTSRYDISGATKALCMGCISSSRHFCAGCGRALSGLINITK